ncbi:type II toxin-antitoxin system MqsR family toxin [Piscirickettsia litoralis]|uniref:type II toxin-antitoxin system MqsR family toxin n=1 Tax=Piscirickettsia litoralis TaxID=1891921 RepID=UPI000981720B|nr:type II toxin-antitoxin system MqsR family toxin [Piscirickettsia litoralis]
MAKKQGVQNKPIATYSLESLKTIFNAPDKLVMTNSAIRGQEALGFTDENVVDVIQALTNDDFYKSMAPYTAGFTAWQDVYKSTFKGIDLYIKFQDNPITGEIILSFKEK